MKTLLGGILSAFLICGCGGGGESACSDENPCRSGMACTPAGVCVQAAALAITTETLPMAYLGDDYAAPVKATGGLAPYTWSIAPDLGWLSIEALTDQTAEISGTPLMPTAGTTVTVTVTDGSYPPGQSVSEDFVLMVSECVEGERQPCYLSEDGVCFSGNRTCTDAVWSPCQGAEPSDDTGHCGDGCAACDPDKANLCDGVCKCGSGSACTGDQVCCGSCADLATDENHCGACGTSCADLIRNATGPRCTAGACDYQTCHAGFQDCDGDRTNGCEAAIDDPSHCGDCATDCTLLVENASGITCADTGAGYACGYQECLEGFLECDGDFTNGCESAIGPEHCGDCITSCLELSTNRGCVAADTGAWVCGCSSLEHCGPSEQCCADATVAGAGQCFALDHPDHCGSCQNSCADNPAGPVCIDPDNGTCGCAVDGDCGENTLCCDGVCTPIDDQHCGACDNDCTVQATNTICIFDQGQQLYHCGCTLEGGCDALDQCCGGTCYDLNDPEHCGDCATNCLQDPRGTLCLDYTQNQCGCMSASDCGPGEHHCCDGVCTPVDDDNCSACGVGCTVADGGPHCYPAARQCYCEQDAECNSYTGSRHTCVGSGTAARCKCGDSPPCAGESNWGNYQCCEVSDGNFSCVDLDDDVNNCGRCGIECQVGSPPNCTWGTCSCYFCQDPCDPNDACPEESPATTCDAAHQHCDCAYSGHQWGCPGGQYCCDGQSGGEGGPNGNEDFGCCPAPCGTNERAACDF